MSVKQTDGTDMKLGNTMLRVIHYGTGHHAHRSVKRKSTNSSYKLNPTLHTTTVPAV